MPLFGQPSFANVSGSLGLVFGSVSTVHTHTSTRHHVTTPHCIPQSHPSHCHNILSLHVQSYPPHFSPHHTLPTDTITPVPLSQSHPPHCHSTPLLTLTVYLTSPPHHRHRRRDQLWEDGRGRGRRRRREVWQL